MEAYFTERFRFVSRAIDRAAICFLILSASRLIAGTTAEESLPAVSEINGKLGYEGGDMNSSTGNNFDGSLTLPVGHLFGVQADALYSRISNLDFYGGGGHFFWRDPGIGLFGVSGGYLYRRGVDTYQAGVEGEYYLGPVTISGFAGVGSIKYYTPAPFIDSNPTRAVARISADYYPLKDLRVGLSYTSAFRDNLGKVEAEYQTPLPGLALTGEYARGDYGYDHWLLGLRYYFGSKKSLIDRQRQDDPPSVMSQILQNLGVYGAEFNQKGNDFLAAHPGSIPGVGSFGSTFSWAGSSSEELSPPSNRSGGVIISGLSPPTPIPARR